VGGVAEWRREETELLIPSATRDLLSRLLKLAGEILRFAQDEEFSPYPSFPSFPSFQSYPRCCLIFPSRVAFGTAPTTVSTCCPFLKNRMLGIERTLNRIAVR
jgi:hypothetical protein